MTKNRLDDEWCSMADAIGWLENHVGPEFVTASWDCKYIDARIDMRTGAMLLRPGNVSIPTPASGSLNARYDPMNRDELIAEIERLRADLAIQTVNATAVLQAQHERDCAIERVAEMRAGLLKAYELLAYGVPDPDLTNSVSGPKWTEECDAWLVKYAPSRLSQSPPEPKASPAEAFEQLRDAAGDALDGVDALNRQADPKAPPTCCAGYVDEQGRQWHEMYCPVGGLRPIHQNRRAEPSK